MKYAKDLLIKFKMKNAYPASTPMEPSLKLIKHYDSEAFDVTMYPWKSCWKFNFNQTWSYVLSHFIEQIYGITKEIRSHWEVETRVLKYIIGTVDHRIPL